MNKKSIIAIAILAIILVAGIYYTVQDKNDSNNGNQTPKEDAVIDENNNKETLPEEKVEEDPAEDPQEEEEQVTLERGKPAPDFTLTTLAGEEVSLSDYEGKIVMMNFWATWCTYCDQEMPDLQRLYEENKDKDFVVLAVNVGEDEKTAGDYIEEGGYTFPVLLDEDSKVAQQKYYVSAYPTSYYIDKDGTLIGAVPGMMTYPQMTQILEQIRNGEI